MADGLDQAADAFRREIAPASQPRDQAGKFVATTSRPEPLFAERVSEGDPTDGQGDEAAKPAADEEQREPPPEQAEDDAEQRDDAQKPDEQAEDEAKDEAEPEPDETARWALTLDGKPVDKFELDINGEKKQLSLAEVIKGYADDQRVAQRETQLADQARAFNDQATKAANDIGAARNEYMTKLDFVNRILSRIPAQAPDDNAPVEQRKAYREFRQVADSIVAEMQREQAMTQWQSQESARQTQEREAEYIDWGKKEFQRRAGLSDDTLNNEFAAMRRALLNVGFTEHEVGRVYDPRMLVVAHGYSEYVRARAFKPRPVAPDRGRALAPGAARPAIGGQPRRGIDDALKKQAASGSVDDTAAVFQRLLR